MRRLWGPDGQHEISAGTQNEALSPQSWEAVWNAQASKARF